MAFQPYKAYLLSQLYPVADVVCLQMQRNMLQVIAHDYGIPIGELYGKYMDVAPPAEVRDGSTQTPTEPHPVTPVTETREFDTQTPTEPHPVTPVTETREFDTQTESDTETVDTQTDTEETHEIETQCDIVTYPFCVEVPRTTPAPEPESEPAPEPPASPVRSTGSETSEKRRPGRPRVSGVPKVVKTKKCAGFTAKGEPCRFCIPDGDTYCKQHEKNPGKSKEQMELDAAQKKANKKGKKPKTQPTHNHLPGDTPATPCQLCDTMGDVLDPDAPSTSYIRQPPGDASVEEVLRRCAAMEEDMPDDEEEEEVTPERLAELAGEQVSDDDDDDDDDENEPPRWFNKIIAEEDGVNESDVDIEQMCETPPSRARLDQIIKDGRGGKYDYLLDDSDEDEDED